MDVLAGLQPAVLSGLKMEVPISDILYGVQESVLRHLKAAVAQNIGGVLDDEAHNSMAFVNETLILTPTLIVGRCVV